MRLHVFFTKVIFGSLFTIAFYSANAQDTARYYIEKGSDYYNKGNYDSAINNFTIAISIDPGKAESYAGRGLAYSSKTWFDSALLDFNSTIRLNPDNAFAHANRGFAYAQKKQFDMAIEDYTKAIDLGHTNSFIYAGRGYAYSRMNKPDLAVFDLNKAIALDSNFTQAYANRGFAYAQKQQYAPAIRDYSKAIRIDTNYSFAYAYRGYAYSQLKAPKPDSALLDLTKAIYLDSSITHVHGFRGFVYLLKNKYDSAIRDFTTAIRMDPGYSLAYSKRGYAYSQLKQFDLAIGDFTKYISLEPGNSDAFESRSLAYFEKKEIAAAMEDIFKSISLNPNYPGYYNTRANFYNLTGKYDSSILDYKTCIAKDSSYGKAYINIISPLIRLNLFDTATFYFELSRKKNLRTYLEDGINIIYRNFVTAVTRVSRAKLNPGKLNLALNNINTVISQYNVRLNNEFKRGYLDILFVKAYILENLDSLEEAKELYKLSLIIDPQQPLLENTLNTLEKTLEKKQALTRSMDTKGPEIKLISPAPNRGFDIVADSSEIEISGTATDEAGIDSVKINGIPARIESNGYFMANLKIISTLSSLQITATDKQGNSTVLTFPINKKGTENPKDDMEEEMKKRKYHAILIAEKDYIDPNIRDLESPIRDAELLKDVLVNQYTFDSVNVLTLYNTNQKDITTAIANKLNNLTDNDNLLIFYAGHGTMITTNIKETFGFLIPSDAKKGNVFDYINSEHIKFIFGQETVKARHILIVLDACFSGALLRETPQAGPGTLSEQNKLISRKVMTSGNVEEVPDSSIFIHIFIKSLRENESGYLSTNDIWKKVRTAVQNQSENDPKYSAFREVGDTGGQFIFRRRKK